MAKLIVCLWYTLAVLGVNLNHQNIMEKSDTVHVDHFQTDNPVTVRCHGKKKQPDICQTATDLTKEALQTINKVNTNQTLTLEKVLKLNQKVIAGNEYELCLKVQKHTSPHTTTSTLYVYLALDILPGQSKPLVKQANLGHDKFPFSHELLGSFATKLDDDIKKRGLVPDDRRKIFPCNAQVEEEEENGKPETANPGLGHGFIEDTRLRTLGFDLSLAQLEELGVTTTGLPINYDARKKYPACAEPIASQGQCGSCWVFAATAVAAQRKCIFESKTNKAAKIKVLSKQDMVSCGAEKRVSNCNKAGSGCDGGDPFAAFLWMRHNGNSAADCNPYQGWGRPKLGFVIKGGSEPPCKNITQKACYANSKRSTATESLFEGAKIQGEKAMKAAIFEGGPISAALRVYKALENYRPGQFKDDVINTTFGEHWLGYDQSRTMHAVVISGWGVTKSGIKYWQVQNSWGPDWGDKGEFKMARGTDLMEIEQHASFVNANPKGPSCPITKCVTASKTGSILTLNNTCQKEVFVRVRYTVAGDSCGRTGRYTKDDYLVSPGISRLNGVQVGKGEPCVFQERFFCTGHGQCPSGQACATIDTYTDSYYVYKIVNGAKVYHELEGGMCNFCHETWKKGYELRSFYNKETLREETKFVEVRKCKAFDEQCCTPAFQHSCSSNPFNCTKSTLSPTASPIRPTPRAVFKRKTKHPTLYGKQMHCTSHSSCGTGSFCHFGTCNACPTQSKSFACKLTSCTWGFLKQCPSNPCKCKQKNAVSSGSLYKQLTVKLVGGDKNSTKGNVYVWSTKYNEYRPVCDDYWGQPEATVVCRELGFASGKPKKYSKFGRIDPSKIVMDDVHCTGGESNLVLCPHIKRHDCGGTEGAGVICNGPKQSKPKEINITESKTPCTNHAGCPTKSYCDKTKHCHSCSYVTKGRCDALDGSCCSQPFLNQCPNNPQRCTPAPTMYPTKKPTQLLSGSCNLPGVRCVAGTCNQKTGICEEPANNAVAALAASREKQQAKSEKLAIKQYAETCKGKWFSRYFYASNEKSISGVRGKRECAIKVFQKYGNREGWKNYKVITWHKKYKTCHVGFQTASGEGPIWDWGENKQYQVCVLQNDF